MHVEMWPIDRVTPYERNPRHSDEAVDADVHGIIIVGHTRWKAARKLGMTDVPVHVAKGLTPEQVKAYRIADNQTSTLSGWDLELLTSEILALKEVDFNLDLLGFSSDDLSRYVHTGTGEGLCDPDEVPQPLDNPVTQRDDLWILGEHRLLCGDSSLTQDVDRLVDGHKIHLVNTDPPYNVRVEPRSNNAISAGLSSFSTTHHQKLDVERHPKKAKPTNKKIRAKDRPLANDFVSDEESSVCSEPGSGTWPVCWRRDVASTFGAAMPTAATTRRC